MSREFDENIKNTTSGEGIKHFEIVFAFTRYIGWIDMFITVDDTTVRIRTSSVYPPYQDFVFFLENIAEDKLPAECIIDEEGIERIIKASPTTNKNNVCLTIGTYNDAIISATFDKRLLIAEFILSWEEFTLNSYDKFKEWWIGQENPKDVDLSLISLTKLEQYLVDNKGTFSIDTSGIHFIRNFPPTKKLEQKKSS